MTNIQAGSRWELQLAMKRTLQTNLQKHADNESDRLADIYGELANSAGSGVLLRIPDIYGIAVAMDAEITTEPDHLPRVVVGGNGTTRYIDAAATTGRQAMGETDLEINVYASTRATYQGTRYRLTAEECTYVATALAQACTDAIRAGGIGSLWVQAAGIIMPRVEGIIINGHASKDNEITAVKGSLRVVVLHEMRY